MRLCIVVRYEIAVGLRVAASDWWLAVVGRSEAERKAYLSILQLYMGMRDDYCYTHLECY